ncbi:protein auxin response 4 [Phtheirospermum japonicum]|uniref:Protein auxin response 4 n=1 Tax=Phtheirospermum japonicum TaxID=374723 RepID=A0A830BI54_9LAMI|nr:protein auxin response 4 [Phtheirospermum japonicum]
MAIITEEPETSKPQLRKSKAKPKPQPQPTSPPSQPPPSATTAAAAANPFQFWFYSTLIVSLTTLVFILLSYLSPQDPKTWFLNLPPILRTHYSSGRTIKVQTAPDLPQIELFSIQQGLTESDSHVLIVHGIGCSSFAFRNVITSLGNKNVHAVAIDLPGSGFSDKTLVVAEDNSGGRWVHEENAEEVAKSIYEFVSTLPEVAKRVLDEPVARHVEERVDGDHDHGHGGHDGHHHAHAGYMDAYGLGHGWGA